MSWPVALLRLCWCSFEWLFGWMFGLTLCVWSAAWCVGSFHAGRCLDLDEVMDLLSHWAARVGLN